VYLGSMRHTFLSTCTPPGQRQHRSDTRLHRPGFKTCSTRVCSGMHHNFSSYCTEVYYSTGAHVLADRLSHSIEGCKEHYFSPLHPFLGCKGAKGVIGTSCCFQVLTLAHYKNAPHRSLQITESSPGHTHRHALCVSSLCLLIWHVEHHHAGVFELLAAGLAGG